MPSEWTKAEGPKRRRLAVSRSSLVRCVALPKAGVASSEYGSASGARADDHVADWSALHGTHLYVSALPL